MECKKEMQREEVQATDRAMIQEEKGNGEEQKPEQDSANEIIPCDDEEGAMAIESWKVHRSRSIQWQARRQTVLPVDNDEAFRSSCVPRRLEVSINIPVASRSILL